MKGIIAAVLIVVSINSGRSQDKSSSHLTFKGIPINGKLEEFVAKLKANGFTLEDIEDGTALLKGDFAGYKSCKIAVVALRPKNIVSKVGVFFPDADTWSALSSTYLRLKEMLKEKYGPPSESLEKFERPSMSKDDNSKMYEVRFDHCKYQSVFETPHGSIRLSIKHESVIKCYVVLVYFDRINGDSEREQALEDL